MNSKIHNNLQKKTKNYGKYLIVFQVCLCKMASKVDPIKLIGDLHIEDFDSEYWQPEYEEAFQQIINHGLIIVDMMHSK